MRSETERNQRIIDEFMKETDNPAWFRGLSTFQRTAAESLLNCIRDDSQQSTSHRVRHALRRIGFEPPVTPANLKLVMNLSRGNDIAFLWFLMELYYRSPGRPNTYSVNEQLFMTVIAYLDTTPTLRELDKILPKKIKQNKIVKSQPVKQKQKCELCMAFPYFQKQPRPILYGKDLTMEIPNHISTYNEPNVSVVNENTRWFARYKLHKGGKEIFDDGMDPKFQEYCENTEICEHHQNLRALKQSLENARNAAKKKDCEKYFDIEEYFRAQSYRSVMSELNREIAKIKMRNLVARRTSVVDNATRLPFSVNEPGGWSSIINIADLSTRAPGKQRSRDIMGVSKQSLNVNIGSGSEVRNKKDLGHMDVDAPLNTKGALFKASTAHKPYKFNYDRIFDMGSKDPVKEAITSALNAGNSGSEVFDRRQAVKKICNEMWSEEVKMYNLKYEREQRALKNAQKNEEEMIECNDCDELNDDNPKDKIIMKVLKKGLAQLKKNKKFVLASLPDAHKWPALKHWARRRYGRYLTRQEIIREFGHTKKVFHALRKNSFKVPCPRLDDLAQRRFLSYGHRDYIFKKSNYLKEVYEQNFKNRLLDEARVYWSAIKPYQCSKGPPRNVFFAYLPSRGNEIHMFRPWKKSEFIDAKGEWDKRNRIKTAELLY